VPKPPNIIYIHSHDTGRYVSPYGFKVRTPNLERFANHGVLFRQAFCNNPTCSPSRACLLTGQYAHTNGMLGLAHRGFRLNDYNHHLAAYLRTQGYHTTLSHFNHVGAAKQQQATVYDEVIGTPLAGGREVADHTIEHLKALRFQHQPFFLAVGFVETHREFPPHDLEDDPRFTRPPLPIPDTPATRKDFADYATMAHRLDTQIGRILDAIDDHHLATNTIVLITTDHGLAFPAMKCNLTDHGTGVMMMMRTPFELGFTDGKCIDAMVQQIDVFPTLCDLAGLPTPDRVQGASLAPLVRGEVASVHDEIFTEVNYHASYEPMRSVRTERYKYIRRFDGRTAPVLPNIDAGLSKTHWLELGYRERPVAEEQLYDLQFDPNEANNLADRPGHESLLDEMRQRVQRWMEQTNDPLLHGPLHMKGAKVNPPDQTDPGEPTVVLE